MCQELLGQPNHSTHPCPNPAKWIVTIKRVYEVRYRCNRCLRFNEREGIVETAVAL